MNLPPTRQPGVVMSSKSESKKGKSAGLFPNSFFCDALRYLLICCFPTLSFAAILPDEAGNGANQIAHIAGFSNLEKAQNGSARPCKDSAEVKRKEEKSDTLSQQTSEQIRSLARPGNSLELLRNIKHALENHWLLDRNFFTPYNLCRLLGVDAEGIEIIDEHENTRFYITIDDSGHTVPLPNLKSTFKGPAGAVFRGGVGREHEMSTGWILLNYGKTVFPFSEIEKVFGRNWARTEQPAPHSLPPQPTSSHGNLDVKFVFFIDEMNQVIQVTTDSGGSVNYIFFKDGGK